jgi:phospholipid transport system substrate-binding protein
MKLPRLLFLLTLGSLTLLFLPIRGLTTDSPLEAVRSTTNRVVLVLKAPENRGPHLREKRIKQVSEIVRPLFDRREVARRTLGVYWRDRTEEQREEFIEIFTELIEKSYGETFDKQAEKYLDQVEFLYDQETIDGNFAEVNTRIFVPSQKKHFSINYRLHQVDGQWLIYDVVVENVSMVRNFRTQFYRIIGKGSYEELVRKLQAKLRQMDATRSPS